MRAFYVVIANLLLPFLLFYLRNVIYKLYNKKVLHNEKKEIKPLDWKMAIKLLSLGIILLGAVLFYFRVQIKPESREHYNQVKQQNLR